jgi:tRNA modification GTPase
LLTRPVAISGVPFLFVDTAGLRGETQDAIEAIGIERARDALEAADLVLWLGEEGAGPAGAWEIAAQADRPGHRAKRAPRHSVSAVSAQGLPELRADLVAHARQALPKAGEVALNERQHRLLGEAEAMLALAETLGDPLLVAEHLRLARVAFDALVGRSTTEHMLDALFGRFCIGK